MNIFFAQISNEHEKQTHIDKSLLKKIMVFTALSAIIALTVSVAAGNTFIKSVPAGPLPLPLTNSVSDYDYYLQGGIIVDGGGMQPYVGDIAFKNGKIVAVGDNLSPRGNGIILDASGYYVTPGFIDIHTHADEYWEKENDGAPILMQGVTTQIVGNCGTSVADISAYLQAADGRAINVGTLIGLKALRQMFISDGAALTPAVLKKICAQTAAAIDAGAFGLSVGLEYYPQNKTTTEQMQQLAEVVASKGAILTCHSRSESNNLIAAVTEAVQIAETTGVKLQYSHLKAYGQANWDKQQQAIQLLTEARARGVDIMTDVHGYTFSSWDFNTNNNPISEDNIIAALRLPYAMVISDGGLYAGGRANHPRAYANATYVLTKYLRDGKYFDIQTMIKKMTLMPARRMGIKDRGLLKTGSFADIAVFKLEDLQVLATRGNPMVLSKGMHYVFVNGRPAVFKGKITGEKSGKALKFTVNTVN